MMIELGSKVKDSVTGFEGIAVIRVEYLKGTTKYVVQGTKLHDGRIVEESFEEGRLEPESKAKSKAA
jgi:hypothetical protein